MLIAHISDLHLLCLDGVRPGDFLGKRLTGGLNLLFNRGGEFPLEVAGALVRDLNRQRPDHLIVSGDLTNLALPAEFRLARGLLEQLALPAGSITVVPGNHDYYTRRSAAVDDFGRILRPFLGEEGFPLLRLHAQLAVLALSSAVPCAPLMAIGRLGVQQLRRAEELLGSQDSRERFRLVVVHHPPAGPHQRWDNRLVDREPLRAILRRTGAELVVHGHLHRFSRWSLPGPAGASIPMVGAGSGTWLSPGDQERRAQYNLYQLEGRRLLAVRRRRYHPGRREFEELTRG